MEGSRLVTAGWLVAAGLLGAALALPATAIATQPSPDHQVTICHATDSDHNPYVRETVDIASSGYVQGGHNEHAGPIWDATLKGQHVKWGDIIPPYTYGDFSFPGMNWSAAGQGIWLNGCLAPLPSPASPSSSVSSPSASVSVSPSLPSYVPKTTVSPSASQSAQPSGTVLGETGTQAPTPPPTDRAASTLPAADSGWQLALLAMASAVASLMAMTPRRTRRR